MQITKDNYELFIIDYLDGKLDSKGKQDLVAFVEANPSIKEEFELLKDAADLEMDSTIQIPDFSGLKKQTILSENHFSDELMIARLEGDLNQNQELEFDAVLAKNEIKQKEFSLYKSTKSIPDLSIVFPNKKALKKGGLIIQFKSIQKYAAAAAVIMILGFLGWMNFRSDLNYQSAQKGNFVRSKIKENNSNSNTENLLAQVKPTDKVESTPHSDNGSSVNNQPEKEGFVEETKFNNQIAQSELINSRTASLEKVKIVFNKFPQQVFPVFNSNTSIAAINPQIDEFKTPGKWLIEKAKTLSTVQPILKTDSLIRNNEVGNVALNLLNQTPGVLATAKTDEEGNSRGFAIMSRYFSFERSY
ncbi:MAG: hypothetical protein ACOVO9_09225 [Bacteroidia bacterium]